MTGSINLSQELILILLAKGNTGENVGPSTDGSSKVHRNKNPLMAALSTLVFRDGPEPADSWRSSEPSPSQRDTVACGACLCWPARAGC